MKKRGFLIYLIILGFVFIPKMVFAETITGVATIGRGVVMDTSNVYTYTDYKTLNSDSINALPINAFTSATDFYIMGAEYSYAISLTGQTNFAATVRVPVATDTIYSYTLTDGLNQNDFKVGISPNFSVYNITPNITSFGKVQGVYSRNGVAHTYIYYDVVFNFVLDQPLTGSYNLNFAMLNTTGNRSTYFYSGGSPGTTFEFPVSYNTGQTTPDAVLFSSMSPSVSLSTGTTSNNQDIIDANNENTELIISNQNENTEALQDTIEQSYENLVKSQEVCSNTESSSVLVFDLIGRINGSGDLVDTSSSFWRTTSSYTNGISNFTNTGTPNIVVSEYDSSKNYLGYYNLSTNQSKSLNPDYFYRFSSSSANSYVVSLYYCKNGNQAIADSILDETIDNFKGSQGLNDIGGQMTTDTPITDLLALPITLLTAIVSGVNGTCSDFNLGNLWGVNLSIPCINLELYLGSDLWNLIDLLFCGFMIFNIGQLMIHDYSAISSAQDLFEETYTPRHEKMRRS